MPDTTALTVLLPVPSMVSGRTGRGRPGWTWVEREVEVPTLASDARCEVPAPKPLCSDVRDEDRPVRGACAGGSHWREVRTRSGAVRPFRLSDRILARENHPSVDVAWSGFGRRRAVDPSDRTVEGTSHSISRTHGVTLAAQALLMRTYGAPGTQTRRDHVDVPYVLKPTAVATPLDPAFVELLLDRARSMLASVDGEPMVRSAPPEFVVVARHWGTGGVAGVRLTYADMQPVAPVGRCAVFPGEDPRYAHEVDRASRDGVLAPFEPDAAPTRRALVSGTVVTPCPVRDPLDHRWRASAIGYLEYGEPDRRDEFRAMDSRTLAHALRTKPCTSGYNEDLFVAMADWACDVLETHGAVPPAPIGPEIDALSFDP